MGLKPGLPKSYSNEGTQIKNCGPLRCKSAKCQNKCYICNTKECIELHDKFHHIQQGKEKVQELKEINYRAVFNKREQRCRNRLVEDTCVNLFREKNEDTPGKQVE